MIKAYIVDDEAPARDEMRYLLGKMPGVEVIGMARNGKEALEQIPRAKPQVVFMDIQMPDISGLGVAKELYQRMGRSDFPILVFATAYDQHALEAFEVNAIDYILKPFNEERLQSTVERIRISLGRRSEVPGGWDGGKLDRILALLAKERTADKLPVEKNERIILLDRDDIVYAGVEGRHVRVKTKDASYLTGYSLSELEERLGLLQTHKSYLVNQEMVREIVPWFNGTYNLIMADKEKSQIPVSRTHVKTVRSVFKL